MSIIKRAAYTLASPAECTTIVVPTSDGPWTHEIRVDREQLHLISAAPDMLEALELAIDEPNNLHCTECNQDPCTCWVGLARAAIKKARGGE